MPHLSAEDKVFFKDNGYLVKHDMLTQEQVEEALDVIWEHVEADRADSGSWIDAGPISPRCGDSPVIRLTLHETPLFDLAEELVGKDKLQKGGGPGPKLNFPTGAEDWAPPEGGHLDGYYTPTNGVPEGTVGRFCMGITLYLNHVKHRGGGFTVWPGTHKQAAEYFKTHSLLSVAGGGARRVFDLPEPVEITGPPGTACLWHGQMVHSASKNCAEEIRMALISRLRRIDMNDILFEFPDDVWEYYDGIV